MRKSFDTLAALVVEVVDEDPLPGHLFLFVNRRRNRAKILWWGRSGYCILAKRLERGQFRVFDLAGDKRFCSVCVGLYQKIGEEVCERAHFVPATFVVYHDVRPKYGCPHGHEIKTADLPDGVACGSKFDASVHAQLVVAKFLRPPPAESPAGDLRRYGIKLPRQTMWDLLVRVDELLAQPILAQMKKEPLEETHLHADESPVKLRIEATTRRAPEALQDADRVPPWTRQKDPRAIPWQLVEHPQLRRTPRRSRPR